MKAESAKAVDSSNGEALAGAVAKNRRRTRRRNAWLITALVFHVVGFFSSINAVMTARTSQGAIAWAISLNTCPYIAVPAYWVLGRSRFQGYVTARRSEDAAIKQKLENIIDNVGPYRRPDAGMTAAGMAAEKLADLPYLSGNSVELLVDGEATFDSILNGIDEAKEYVLVQFFIVHDDELGRALKERLMAKAKEHLVAKVKEGVKVYFIYDEVGSHDLTETYIDDLRESGVDIRPFNTRKGIGNRFQINFRNHRKIVVVDGKAAWIGGHNVGDEYVGKDPEVGRWRDTHIKIEGPAVLGVQISFAEDWYWATEQKIPELVWTPTPASDGNQNVLIVPTGPADELESATLMFTHAINSAKERIWIATPYFVPDDMLIGALQLAGLRGVDVRIVIPDNPDQISSHLAGVSYYEDASKTGGRFFLYTDGFLHQKVMLIDDDIATVGTANFDNRSFRLNFEITGVIHDQEFAAEIEQMFEDDFKKSREMTQADIDNQSFWERLGSRLARLTAPIQ